ncbi:MAG: 50S ribosomal protein L30 [Candidatus Aenigmatarchaeota archaeon]
MIAVIRVRGGVDKSKEIKDTLKMLNLKKVNHCVVVRKDPSIEGMIKKVKDFVTWGEISESVFEKLLENYGRKNNGTKLSDEEVNKIINALKKNEKIDVKNFKLVFRLKPPKKGYKSIKKPYPKGALGYRGDKINELIERMM